MTNENKENNYDKVDRTDFKGIDLGKITKLILSKRKTFYRPLIIVFVVSCIYIFSLPRYYSTDAKLAPEMDNPLGEGSIGSIASAFGFSFGDMQTSDAINPLLYPNLMEDNAFVSNLFSIQVETAKGDINTSYFNYLLKNQKKPWWSTIKSWISNLFASKPKNDDADTFDPYKMNIEQDGVAGHIRANINLSVDKKTGIISVTIKDQDPLVCKTIGDSVINLLQEFITEYRTNKANIDVQYYTALVDSAREEYKSAYQKYADYSDANTNVILQHFQTKLTDLENDMQLKYQTYSALTTQLQAAKGKVQERTPVFTIVKGASVPLKPAGPKRVFFVLCMTLLTTFCVIAYILLNQFKKTMDQM